MGDGQAVPPGARSGRPSTGVVARGMVIAVRGYQRYLAWATRGWCRFEPSCSAYAIEALERHGAARGGWMAASRLVRCNPWGGCGHDPVP